MGKGKHTGLRKLHLKAYSSWMGMKTRCKPNFESGKYSENKITVCERWLDSFENFLKDMGDPPIGYTLERENNLEGYNKENCKWATRKIQSRNTSSNVKITYNGETMVLMDWCIRLNIKYSSLRKQVVTNKVPFEQAVIHLLSNTNK
jgi:hypothetical protein